MSEQRLLARLRKRVNASGVVTIRADLLAAEIGAALEEVGAALESLEQRKLLTVLVPPPFLVLRLHSWRGAPTQSQVSHAYSHSRLLQSTTDSYSPSGDDVLLHEILDTLGESDPKPFEGAIRHFAPDVIRKALDRVRRARSVRKNRTALFRYLLTRLS